MNDTRLATVPGSSLFARWTCGVAMAMMGAVAPSTLSAQSSSVSQVDALRQRLDASADSAGIEKQLESLIRTDPKNGGAWHLLGTLRWKRVAAQRRGGYMSDKNTINTLMGADSALRLATQFSPDSARYWLTLARFGLESGVASVRFAAAGQLQRAYGAAKRSGDKTLLAQSADEVGMSIWRRYELVANRALATDNQRVQLQTQMQFKRGLAKSHLATFAKKIVPPTGDADYLSAVAYFREASELAPVSLAYARHLYMAYSTKGDWESLLAVARHRIELSAFDAQARLAEGLALQRLGRRSQAAAAFASASELMDDTERERLFRVDRLLPPGVDPVTGKRGFDSLAMARSGEGQQRAMNSMYWQLNDPDSRTSENEVLVEFSARVAESEFRWTDEVQQLAGADSDRGDIFIRYGPPADVMTLSGSASLQQLQWDTNMVSAAVVMSATSQEGGTTLVWTYASGDVFFFDMAPGFGTARTPLTDQNYVREFKSVAPVRWTNIVVPTRVATLPVKAVRFRGAHDSTDVVIATQIPTRRLIADSAATSDPSLGGSVLVETRIVDGSARTLLRDTTAFRTTAAAMARGTPRVLTARIGAGAAFVRVVADHSAPSSDERRTANALVAVQGERASGFGLSDVLLTKPSGAPAATEPARWSNALSDSRSEASAGVYAVGEKVGLLWEIYALADSNSTSRYRITVTVERTKRTGVSGFALRVLDGVGALLRAGSSGGDQLAISFDRSHVARPVVVEQLTLEGLTTAPGDYRVRVEVVDLVRGTSAKSEQGIVVERTGK